MKMFINFINRKKDLFLIFFILIISLYPRLNGLIQYPSLIVDEPANLRDINKLLTYNNFHPVDYDWAYSQGTIVYYPTILLIKLGFDELLALRLTSVILSLLLLIPFFFIVKKYTNSIVAFSSTLTFSFSYYFLQFSRVGWNNIYAVCLGFFLIWFINLAIEKKTIIMFLFSGVTAGLLMYVYRSGEIYILASIILLIIEIIKHKSIYTKILNFATFLFGFLLISTPWIIKILSNWELYNLRARVVSVFNTNLPYHGLYNRSEIMNYQIFSSIKAWILMLPLNGREIENQRYLPLDHAVVSPIIAALFLIGVIIAIYRFKETFIWILIYILGLIFGQILTVDPPNGSRGLMLLPIIYIFSALTLSLFYNRFKESKLLIPALIIASAIISYIDYAFYQNWMTWIKV